MIGVSPSMWLGSQWDEVSLGYMEMGGNVGKAGKILSWLGKKFQMSEFIKEEAKLLEQRFKKSGKLNRSLFLFHETV